MAGNDLKFLKWPFLFYYLGCHSPTGTRVWDSGIDVKKTSFHHANTAIKGAYVRVNDIPDFFGNQVPT